MAGNAVPDRDEALRRGDELWAQLSAALDKQLDGQVDPAGWTGKDVYAHFARWQQTSIDQVRELIAGRRPTKPGEDENVINDRWAEEDRSMPADVARARCLATRDEHRAQLAALSAEHWRAFGHYYDDVTGPHYEHHLRAAGIVPLAGG